jgi:tetratricopeptide (TPR) repeat protein
MGKKKKTGQAKSKPAPEYQPVKKKQKTAHRQLFWWYVALVIITGICLFPMLDNQFTNWDDDLYVTNNNLITGPDWKGIFTQPVAGNYHPVTMLSLAFNYALSDLQPFSYMLLNYLLHIINTALVFYFIHKISGGKTGVAAFTAVIFGIHPMHVESVAWIAERKDVLYTLFFLLALLQYWKFLESGKRKYFWFTFLLFILSLLSKPAAVILPLVLLLLDYWKGRTFTSRTFIEKIPFFLLSFFIGILTIQVQSSSAMAGLHVYSITDRLLFGCYTLMTYFIRFFVPHPLSAFHPFPAADNPGWQVIISPLFALALLFILWRFRKNKIVIFGLLFYIINLLLVLQVLSIGLTIVSERYTYVPYIGLAFMLGMLAANKVNIPVRLKWATAAAVIAVFGFITFQRTKVWNNSGTLWTDVIKTYPDTPIPRSNRAHYISIKASEQTNKAKQDSLYRLALEDCNIALQLKPNLAAAFEKRGLIYIGLGKPDEALADADSLVKYDPGNKIGYDIRGTVYFGKNEPAKAMENYNKCIEINPNDHRSYSNRGTIYLNFYQQYEQALQEFNKAISIKPVASYILNRSICYYKMGNMQKAREDALRARDAGAVIPDNYKGMLQLQ